MTLADFHFLRPWWLLAMIPAIVLAAIAVRHGRGVSNWLKVCDAELLPYILDDAPGNTARRHWLPTVAVALLAIVALAGPAVERLPGPAFRNQSALVIALDLSKSMDAADVKPSRVIRARYKIADLLRQRKDGQTALLVYGGEAFTVTPLTSDNATVNSQLEALTTDIMPSPGSNPVIAIKRAVELLKNAGVAAGHILLVSDGVDSRDVAAAVGTADRYALSILALGSEEGAPIPQAGGGFVKDADGNIVIARLDTQAITALAERGHGLMQIATHDDSDIERLTAFFDGAAQQAQTEDNPVALDQWNDLGPWLTLLLVPWAALRFRRGLLILALAIGLPMPRDAMALDWQTLWQSSDQRAQHAFDAERYDEAAAQFQDPAWRAAAQYRAGRYQDAAETLKEAASADGHYNRGNALAKAGQLQDALQAYNQALALDPGHADARYNKELVEQRLNKQQSPSDPQSNSSSDDRDSHSRQADDDRQDAASKDAPSPTGDDAQADGQPESGQTGDQAPDSDGRPDNPDDEERPDDVRRPDKSSQRDQDSTSKNAAVDASETQGAQHVDDRVLKRIPDEPTGLLKRKFRYQYRQRDPPHPAAPTW